MLLFHLDVFDSTADESTGLERIPRHVKDLQEHRHQYISEPEILL